MNNGPVTYELKGLILIRPFRNFGNKINMYTRYRLFTTSATFTDHSKDYDYYDDKC
ncbi:hypothetical protein JCM14036_24740 [Desulfotomaculum defluvii]